jgi:hypothetical protein
MTLTQQTYNMEKQLLEVLNFLENRSSEFKQEFNLGDKVDGLDEKQSSTMRTLHMGEAQGLDLAVLAIKQFVLR